MADVTQAASTLLPHAILINADSAAGFSVVGSEVDVRTYLSALVNVFYGPIEAVANDPGVRFILQGRQDTGASINENWAELWTFSAPTGVPVIANITGAEAIGQTAIGVDDDVTATYNAGDVVYIKDASGGVGVFNAGGEWARVAHVAAANIDLVDGLTNAKDATDFIHNEAEIFAGSVDLSGLSYVRMIVQGGDASGGNIEYKATMIAFTDIA